ncbi:MAG: ribbon-helix-helix domain-containing protein [Anaerolineae bacterium]|nr:ribbon-helix-helix domain-containing protein [Anaerolineae bacterium]
MSIKSVHADMQKITISLPKSLLARLNEHIPARRRSRFIAEAIEEQLALAEQMAVLDETAGAWSDANHPEMATEEDIDRWLVGLRSSWGQPGATDRG